MDKQTQFLELKKQASKIVDKLSRDNFVVLGALAVSDTCERFNSYLRDHGVDPVDVYQEIGTSDITTANLFGDVVTNWADGLDGFGSKTATIEEDVEIWTKMAVDEYHKEDGELDELKVYDLLSDSATRENVPQDIVDEFYKKRSERKYDNNTRDNIEARERYDELDAQDKAEGNPSNTDALGGYEPSFQKGKRGGDFYTTPEGKRVYKKKASVESFNRIKLLECFKRNAQFNDADRCILLGAKDEQDLVERLKKTSVWNHNPFVSLQFLNDVFEREMVKVAGNMSRQDVFRLGRDVNEMISEYSSKHDDNSSVLRPSNEAISYAANKLGLSKADARRATDHYNFGHLDNDFPKIKKQKEGIKSGDSVEHGRFGKGTIESVDDKTYSIPMAVVKLENGEKIARPLNEFKEVENKNKEQKSVAFKDLSEDMKAKAKELYIKDTGDKDEGEKGWENYYYDVKTGELTGDDEINLGSEPKDPEKINRKKIDNKPKDTFTMDTESKEPEKVDPLAEFNSDEDNAIEFNSKGKEGNRFGNTQEEKDEEAQWNLDHPQVERTPEQNKTIKENFDKVMGDKNRFNFGDDEPTAGAVVPKPTPDAPVAGGAENEMTEDEYRQTPEYYKDKQKAYDNMKGNMDGAKADKKAMEKYYELKNKSGNVINTGWWNNLSPEKKMEYIQQHKRTKKQSTIETLTVTASLIKQADMNDFELQNIENGVKELASSVLSGEDMESINLYATIRKAIDSLKSEKMLAHEQDGYRHKGIVANV